MRRWWCRMAVNFKICPNCGSMKTLRIVYGMPTHDTFVKAEEGKIKLGGCLVMDNNPEYYCSDCNYEWNRDDSVNYVYNQIKHLKATVGGYFGGYYEVTIDLHSKELKWKHFGCGHEEEFQKTVRNTTADRFVEELKSIDILNWKSKYVELDILDGTQWSIEIQILGKKICKHGSNKYPESWDKFCRLMKKISGKKFR